MLFGGGHAATIAVRATKKGLMKPTAIAAVAPTWAGPLPIVFGRDSNMETRYSPYAYIIYIRIESYFILFCSRLNLVLINGVLLWL